MTPERYRKRPVVIEAVQFDGENGPAAIEWMHECGASVARYVRDGYGHLVIPTLEGLMVANPGDWIIRGVIGEFYACKPDIFDMTYEAE